MQALARRVEAGGALTFSGVAAPAQPFFAALLQKLFPQRPVVVVAENLKTQESFQQDLETWMAQLPSADSQLLFYPAWEILPHEDKLPHADVISDRLQTLVALSEQLPTVKPQIRNSSSRASPRCCKKLFRPAKSRAARGRSNAATKSRRWT